MKHAAEVMDLLQSQPPRAHRMAHLVQAAAAGRTLTKRERNAMRQAILRLLETLREGGYVRITQHARNSVVYHWADVTPPDRGARVRQGVTPMTWMSQSEMQDPAIVLEMRQEPSQAPRTCAGCKEIRVVPNPFGGRRVLRCALGEEIGQRCSKYEERTAP